MKKTTLILCLLISYYSLAQCPAGSFGQFPSTTINAGSDDIAVQINGCNYTGEYSVVDNIVPDSEYEVVITKNSDDSHAYVTVENAVDNSVIAHGESPLQFTAPQGVSTVNLIWSDSDGCEETDDCFTTSIQCTSCESVPVSENTSCAEAELLECGQTIEGNSTGTDGSYEDIGCGLGVNGLWYTFVGTGLNVTVTSTASFDHEMGIASGQCGALVNESCTDASLGAESYTLETVENETYYVYIAHYFTDDNTTGTVSITLECAEIIVPDFLADFSSFPDGWLEANGPIGSPDGNASSWLSDDFGNDPGHPNGSAARVNIFGGSIDEYLISPVFNLSGGTYYLNFDIALVDWDTTDATVLGPDDYVALLVTQDDGANWTELRRWDENTSIGATREATEEIELSGYGAEVQFTFYAFSDTTNADTDFFMDNFSLTANSLSNEEFNQMEIAFYPNPTDGKIYFQTQDIVNKIVVYNMLGQIIHEAEPNQLSPELDLSKAEHGAYFVEINQGEMSRKVRIIKN